MKHKKSVADIMTRETVAVFEEENLFQVMDKLNHHAFRHLPVVDGSKLVGMLSQRDMLRATISGVDHGAMALAREARYLEQTFVRDLMQTTVVTARPEESIQAVARRMLEHRIGALPVTDDQANLLGIVTENDLVRQLAEEL